MIGFLQGKVIFSDGTQMILLDGSGVGHQVFYPQTLKEGSEVSLYICEIIKENARDLYGFTTLLAKRLFEFLITVKGVGAKSASSLLSCFTEAMLINIIIQKDKKALTKAPGIGPKAAAQIILDLAEKIKKTKIFISATMPQGEESSLPNNQWGNIQGILEDTLLACKELGFQEHKIMALAQKMMQQHKVESSEELTRLVLREV